MLDKDNFTFFGSPAIPTKLIFPKHHLASHHHAICSQYLLVLSLVTNYYALLHPSEGVLMAQGIQSCDHHKLAANDLL